MGREQCDVLLLKDPLKKELVEVNTVIQVTDTVLKSTLGILKNQKVFGFKVPKRIVDSG